MFELSYPLNIQVEVTEVCNHRCFYCYNSWQQDNSKKHMTIENSLKLIDLIESDIKPFQITLTGGEPLLNLESVLTFARGFKRKSRFYNLNTNLSLLNKERLEILMDASTNRSLGILTSLPCYRKDKYEQITRAKDINSFFDNMKYLLENTSLPLTVNMVVHKLNYDDVYEEAQFLFENFGVKNFTATPVIFPANLMNSPEEDYCLSSEEIVKLLETLLKIHNNLNMNVDSLETIPRCLIPEELRKNELNLFRRSCSAGRSTISIDYKGGVRACSHSPFVVGNLFKEDFKIIWNFFKPFRESVYAPKECNECAEFFLCNGGCRFFGYKEGDSLNRKDPRMTSKIKKIVRTTKKIPQIDEQKKYTINPRTRYREEKEDLFTFFSGDFANVLFVNNDLKDFVLYLQNLKEFDISTLLKNLGKEEIFPQLENTLKVLIDRKILI